MNTKAIAYCCPSSGIVQYVEGVPGPQTGWRFTEHRTSALALSPYWQRRFAVYCARNNFVPMYVQLSLRGRLAA